MSTYPTATPSPVNITKKARAVARIFDALASVIAAIGGLAILFTVIAAVAALFTDGGVAFPQALLLALIVGIYTALMWASVTLGTVVAGYIANKSE